ncbi:T9SS type A sorting domain-containing protein [Aurantibacillus circumpalustris]|uniref:T9SS type A sorting domain-containing protein n=1 Tax=Aurantibacillus circumpalustris TaxID=3036359 RepID=UPI00295AE430|nr:T9SS type A sorting domain-containing protein [Aurantibacillus circumpalustris]
MKKNLIACLLQTALIFNCSCSFAQQTYLFSKTTGNAYSDLLNDNNVPAFNPAGLYNIMSFQGETFKFFDVPFTFGGLKTLAIGEAPFLRVDNDSSAIIIDVAFSYIDTIDATSRISYATNGTAGSKILKVQYKNFKLSYGQGGNFINTQIWYYQQTGVIELHYGPRSTNNASGFNTSNGPNIGIFYSPDNFGSCYEKLWCNGSPGNLSLDSAATLVFSAMSGVPDQGTVFKFTPKTTATVSTVSVNELSKANGFELFPNPASTAVEIKGDFASARLDVYDLTGKIVKQISGIATNTIEINISDLPEGFYNVAINNQKTRYFSKLVIVH